MDELLSAILRFLGYVVSELLLGTFFYAIGWPFVKAVTLGKYPKREWLSGSKNEAYVCCVGILVFAISLMAALGQFSAQQCAQLSLTSFAGRPKAALLSAR
ncbi:hypothetical protein U8L64_06960 [Pseudomonas sp. FIP_A4]|uniref:hypothetical protein n=1 Tax=Pseudomonas sp. FIP_A4 TaxID=3070684 RepID=UPI002FCFE911